MSTKLNLPLHPSMRHPLTGEPLRAIYRDRHGRPRYPIMGGAPEGDDDAAKAAAAKAAEEKAAADKAAADKAAADKAAADAANKDDLGFPKDTPVAEMKPAEQAAYWQHQARKHEDRNKEWQKTLGGKTAAEIAAEREELTKLRDEKKSDGEKAVDEAKTQGRREASLALAPQMFDVALAHVEEDRRKVLIDTLDLSKVIKEDGTIDTDKVTSIAKTLAPPATGNDDPDYGGGPRRTGTTSGVSAGRDRYRERYGKKPDA